MPDTTKPTQEQRLAAKLRENLKRRKEQARARAASAPPLETAGKPPSDSESTLATTDQVALKPAPESDS
jgi:hypothetical protein